MLVVAGADHVITMDLHASQIQARTHAPFARACDGETQREREREVQSSTLDGDGRMLRHPAVPECPPPLH
jgi:phosphoribosylpyrophosphate synthetase